ncbi:TNF receptor-associated factor 6-like [Corticium candelabrum]|uniref:TNF receptor-associated factor 6-like n=1 Tax=Corticium candelabrum TaxID=121492 RepID=UPI002E25C1E9|nr:TNF receptor-associated factor 6-like [Corticium candelabrum]
MATQATRGFDEVFVEPLSERLTCPICHVAFREPVLTRCGHHFCNNCLMPCLQQSASCPVCRMELEASNIFPNNAMKREILDLIIKCCLHEKGCAWTGELRNGEMHDRECQYVDVVCDNECGQLIMRKDKEDHMANHCLHRMISCENCDRNIKQLEIDDHYKECDKYPINCTYKCGMMVQRCKMEDHIGRRGTCPNSLLGCDFEDSGCQFRGNRHDLCKHIENNIGLHFSLIASALRETNEKSAASEHQLKQELNNTKEELRATRDEMAETRDELAETRNELAKTKDELEKTRGKLTKAMGQLSVDIHRRSLSLLPQTPKQFLFTWTIDNWQEKMQLSRKAASVTEGTTSSSFYVYPGYHLYIGAYPNGINASCRDYLSLFLFPRIGDFDSIVSWPFPYSLAIELVDQQVGGENIFHRALPHERGLQPSKSKQGRGFSRFVSRHTLRSRCYIKDDSICIKLHVYVKNEEYMYD